MKCILNRRCTWFDNSPHGGRLFAVTEGAELPTVALVRAAFGVLHKVACGALLCL